MFISIFLVIMLVISGFVYFFISQYSFDDFYKRLEIRSFSTARSELDLKKRADLIREFKGEYLEPLPKEKNTIIQLSEDNKVDFRSMSQEYNIPSELLEQGMEKESNSAFYHDGNLFYNAILYEREGKRYLVITSAENYFYSHHISYLKELLIIALSIGFVVVVVVSAWFSKKVVDPIKSITNKVNEIGTNNLYVRLEKSDTEDELNDLTNTFNDMLDRLETSFETQNNFISNASHELNTPLTAIIGQADVTLSRDRKNEEYKIAIENILNEAEKLEKKTKALLYLAQTAFNGKRLVFDKVRVDQLLFDVQETINKTHTDNKVTIDLSLLPENPEKLKVHGNEHLLHLAVYNIIINAYKYSNNQEVLVSLGISDSNVQIIVKDRGIGIPKEELKYIYDPFFRASNTGNHEGYGIGLPLTRNIIRIHKGSLKVISEKNNGTIVQVSLPIGNYKL